MSVGQNARFYKQRNIVGSGQSLSAAIPNGKQMPSLSESRCHGLGLRLLRPVSLLSPSQFSDLHVLFRARFLLQTRSLHSSVHFCFFVCVQAESEEKDMLISVTLNNVHAIVSMVG